jgi:SAM-dependent methyltransferase
MRADLNRYEDPWTAEVYDYQTQGRGNDVPFWLALAEESGGPVLEVGCGTGRVTIPVARAGHEVTGLDMSPNMLAVARSKLEQESREVQTRVSLEEGDMRGFSLGQRYGLVLIPYSAFQVLLEREDQRSCLTCCGEHLEARGRLAIDVFHPKLSRLTREIPVQEGPEEFDGPEGVRVQWSGETEYDLAKQNLRSRWRYERAGDGGKSVVSEHLLELHYFFRFEMEWMLEACGFEVEALYGDFERSPFAADSPEMVFVARRAGP